MPDLPDLEGRVTMNDADLDRFVNNVERQVKKTENSMRDLGESFKKAGDKVTLFGSVPVAAGLLYATKAASDLNESLNVTKVTFGAARGEVDAFTKSAEKIGLSERAAREATGSFGGLLQNLGYTAGEAANVSISLTKLGSDLGSVFNKEPVEAAIALQSALRGETEPIRAFNVSLDDAAVRTKAVQLGLARTSAEVDKHGKAVATLAIIQEQTNRYQGDFLNTQDGLANKSRQLKAELENQAAAIGNKLLPAALSAAKGLDAMIDAFSKLSDTEQYAILGIGAFVVGLGPALKLGGNLLIVLDKIKAGYAAMGAVSFATNLAGLSAIGLALGAIGYSLISANNDYDKFKANINGGLKSSNLESVRLAFNATHDEAGRLIDKTKEVQNQFNVGLAKAADRAASDAVRLRKEYDDLSQVLQRTAQITGLTVEETQALADKVGVDLTGGVNKASDALVNSYLSMKTSTLQTEELKTSTSGLSDKVKTAKEKYDEFKTALDTTFGSLLSADEATLALAEKTADLSEKYKEAKGSTDLHTEAGRNLRSALFDTLGAVETETEALGRSGIISSDAAAQKVFLRQKLEELQKTFPGLRDEIQVYIDKVNAIPDEAVTKVGVTGADKAAADLQKVLDKLNEIDDANMGVNDPALLDNYLKATHKASTTPWPIGSRPSALSNVPHRAAGGPVSPGNWYEVNEMDKTGREFFRPSVPGFIEPSSTVNNGGDVYVDVTINGVDNADSLRGVLPELTSALKSGVGAK